MLTLKEWFQYLPIDIKLSFIKKGFLSNKELSELMRMGYGYLMAYYITFVNERKKLLTEKIYKEI